MSGSKVWFVTGAGRGFGRLWEVYADRIKTWDAWKASRRPRRVSLPDLGTGRGTSEPRTAVLRSD